MEAKCVDALKDTKTVTEKLKLKRKDGMTVPVLVSLPASAEAKDVKRAVIIVHGMGSAKEASSSEYYRLFFNKKGYGTVLYDQPGHGTEEASEEDIRVLPSLDSLEAVETFTAERFPGADLVYFASSYGGYITGLYVRTRKHLGRRAFFRSGAVIFPEMITGGPGAPVDPQAKARLDQQGYMDVSLGGDAPVRFSKGFMEDLMKPEYDLITLYRERMPEAPIAMAHGGSDIVVPTAAAKAFAEGFGIPITIFPGQGHSLDKDPEAPGQVGDLAVKWYDENK